MGISFESYLTMRVLLTLAILIAVVSAAPKSDCEQKNEILKKAILKLSPKPKDDCNICYDVVFAAAKHCLFHFDWQKCIFDQMGALNPCAECVCDLIHDIGGLFGQDWKCHD